MTFRLISDIHIDCNKPDEVILKEDDSDVIVVPGDICSIHNFAQWVEAQCNKYKAIVIVLGNHDYWKMSVDNAHRKWKEGLSKKLPQDLFDRIHILEKEYVDIGDTRYFGTTLWTDMDKMDVSSMQAIKESMVDYKRIRMLNGARRLTPQDVIKEHIKAKEWLTKAVELPWEGHKVIVTHHAPSFDSLYPFFGKDSVSGAYASDLEDMLQHAVSNQVFTWVHGHTHAATRYEINGLNIIVNPFGYPDEDTSVDEMCIVSL
jgi:predicted phosphodiesterase